MFLSKLSIFINSTHCNHFITRILLVVKTILRITQQNSLAKQIVGCDKDIRTRPKMFPSFQVYQPKVCSFSSAQRLAPKERRRERRGIYKGFALIFSHFLRVLCASLLALASALMCSFVVQKLFMHVKRKHVHGKSCSNYLTAVDTKDHREERE